MQGLAGALSPGGKQTAVRRGWLPRLLAPLARPPVAGLVALAVYLARAAAYPQRLARTDFAYFNYLAEAFLHGQLHLRWLPPETVDLVFYGGRVYLYWPPFPALLVAPLVALFGLGVSDVVYTAVIAAVSVALVARLLAALDEAGIAPLDAGRRGLLVATCAFGSVLLIVAHEAGAWATSQVVGWTCLAAASVAALTCPDRRGYLLTGLALACATATRLGLLCGGLWLAYYLLRRDRCRPWRWWLSAAALGLAPVVVALLLLSWYNAARFGDPRELGLPWHNMSDFFRADYERHGMFSPHYLPINLYYHFLAPPFTALQRGMGGGFFWMTPVFLAAPHAAWVERRQGLVRALVLSCALLYVPIGLVMGVGYLYGSRYLLDLFAPLLVLAALGVGRWRLDWLQVACIASVACFAAGSALLLLAEYS